ncbi:cystathionine beta-synthase [Ilyonectria robusta]
MAAATATASGSASQPLVTSWSSRYRGSLLDSGKVKPEDQLTAAMTRFQRRGRTYRVITMETPLEDLEDFFRGGQPDGAPWKQEFAVITDEKRRFVLGVATVQDLEEFAKRRPA